LIGTFRSAGIASSATFTACKTAFFPSSSRLVANQSVYGIGGHVAMGVTTAWTTVSGMFLIAASPVAQLTAAVDAGEPSTATTMP